MTIIKNAIKKAISLYDGIYAATVKEDKGTALSELTGKSISYDSETGDYTINGEVVFYGDDSTRALVKAIGLTDDETYDVIRYAFGVAFTNPDEAKKIILALTGLVDNPSIVKFYSDGSNRLSVFNAFDGNFLDFAKFYGVAY